MSGPDSEWSVQNSVDAPGVGDRLRGDPARLFQALASSRRLALLWTLCGADGAVSMSEAARRIPERERELLGEDGPPPTPEQVTLTLRHVHVEKLRAADLVTFDEDERMVRLATDPETIVDLLESVSRLETSTDRP